MTDFYGGFVAGLRVHTDRGPVAIDELNVGDRVLSRAPSTGESSFMPIIRTFTHRDRPIRCVTYLFEGRMIGVMATDDVSFGVAVAAGSLIKGERIGMAIDGLPPGVAAPGWARADAVVPPDEQRLIESSSTLCHELLLMDGRRVVCIENEEILSTDRPLVGWYASMRRSRKGTALDFSGKVTLVATNVKRTLPTAAGGEQRLLATVHNIEVADNHSFYVGQAGVLVHDGKGH